MNQNPHTNFTRTPTSPQIYEKILHPIPGIPVLFLCIVGIICSIALIVFAANLPEETVTVVGKELAVQEHPLQVPLILLSAVVLIPSFCLGLAGLCAVSPNEALVLTLFGNYHGTINKPGFFFVNPFCSAYNPTKSTAVVVTSSTLDSLGLGNGGKDKNNSTDRTSGKKISLKAITLSNRTQKVNDLEGNPIEIAAMVIWRVRSPALAVFAVDNYLEFISMQADSTLRNVACGYAYDDGGEPVENVQTLRGNSQEIALQLQNELENKVISAGLEVLEVKITHLAYAPEIAAAMLQRQQATAILQARRLIVEGAVGMVQQALGKLDEENIVELDDERKAAMISNLLVVLCANKEAQPVVNSGSIY